MSNLLTLFFVYNAALMVVCVRDGEKKPHMPQNGAAKHSFASAEEVMAERFVHHTNLLATQKEVSRSHVLVADAQSLSTGLSAAWGVILLVIIPLTLILFMVFVCMSGGDADTKDPEQNSLTGALVYGGYGTSPQPGSVRPAARSPGQPVGPAPSSSVDPFLTKAAPAASMSSLAPPARQQQSPVVSPPASGLLNSIPSMFSSGGVSGGVSSLPPQLCSAHPASPGKTILKIPKVAVQALYKRHSVEVLGAFDYPVAYARLGRGPEGSRLEISSEPSWKNIEVTLGPLDWPGNLGRDAMIHGPNRELYGSFQRTTTGFAVGHYGQPAPVLSLNHKMMASGISIELRDGSDKIVATVSESGPNFHIDVSPGLDAFLVVTSSLAIFVASQFLIDELQSSMASV